MRYVNDDGLGDVNTGDRPDQVLHYRYTDDNNKQFDAYVRALDQSDTADVLSTPRVTTMNGEEATIRMVKEVYYPEQWGEADIAESETYSVFTPSIPEFGDPTEEGIVLRVTPNVDADRYTITLDMNPVIQRLVGWTNYSYNVSVTGSTYTNRLVMPVIEARTVMTSVTIYDGETIVLGGIIKDNVDTINDKIPILGEFPLVGRMFQSKAKRSTKTNLLIFLSCRLVNPDGSPIRERELRGLPAFRQ
jgi:general secretion pathway protein D